MSLSQGAYGRKGIKEALLAGPFSRPSAPPKPLPDGLPSTVGIPIQRSTTAASRKFKLQEKKASLPVLNFGRRGLWFSLSNLLSVAV